MSSTQVLLSKIAALRQRLAQVEGLANDAGSAATSLAEGPAQDPVQLLERKVVAGSWQTSLLDGSIRQLPGAVFAGETPALPTRLTARGARLLQKGRDLLDDLRGLADDPLLQKPNDSLARLYRETAAMIDALLRSVQAFPEAPSAQVRLCDGLEVVLGAVTDRLARLGTGLEHRRRQNARVENLAQLLETLAQGQDLTVQAFLPLTEEVLDEARQGLPLRFCHAHPKQPSRFVACHGLNVAQVIARLVHVDPDLGGRPHDPVLAALVHDVGMVQVPAGILTHSGPLTDAERRQVENHPTAGAQLLAHMAPGKTWLAEAVAAHHERIDGTGYPAGLRQQQLPPLVRLLMVCDVYAALCSPRPYRPALETRAALTDTLLLAEQGALDQFQAERLLDLSFYPVGSVVELADGAVGVVVATHPAKMDLHNPARPIVAMLTDTRGQPLPFPSHLDLAQCQDRSIVRSLPSADRMELVGRIYPELV